MLNHRRSSPRTLAVTGAITLRELVDALAALLALPLTFPIPMAPWLVDVFGVALALALATPQQFALALAALALALIATVAEILQGDKTGLLFATFTMEGFPSPPQKILGLMAQCLVISAGPDGPSVCGLTGNGMQFASWHCIVRTMDLLHL